MRLLCRWGWHRWRYHDDPPRRRCAMCSRHQILYCDVWVNG